MPYLESIRARLRYAPALIILPLLGAGCISFGGATKQDGGLFATKDRGEQWVQRGAIPSVSSPRSLANANVTVIAQDPQDRMAIYVGTDTSGGFYSWDGGNAWWPLGAPFSAAKVNAIAVDPKATCTILVAAEKRVYKTTDCARSWRSSDFESTVTALALDPAAPSTFYAGTSKGDLLKSIDGGASWRAVHRLENRIRAILLPSVGGGEHVVIAATQTAGLAGSADGGQTWVNLRKGMEQYPAAFDFKAIIVAPDRPRTLLYASKYGILRSVDVGTTWQPITLITAPGAVDIFALAVNPRDGNHIAYATATTFYKTSDGGRSWVSKKLPTTRAAAALLVDHQDGNVIWMGTLKIKK